MNIETELTPNPETLKFIVDKNVINQHGIEVTNMNEAKNYKFTKDLFNLKGIKSFYIGPNFVAVTKNKDITWNFLKTKILTFLLDYVSSNKNIIEKKQVKNDSSKKIVKNKISSDIEKIINEKVRPAVERDGGDIIFESFNKGVVYLTLRGACVGCPSSQATLKQGIENLLMHYFPQVKEVRATN